MKKYNHQEWLENQKKQKREFEEFKSYIKTFTTKDVEIVFGPKTSLNNVLKKRIIRRNISLIKKNNE